MCRVLYVICYTVCILTMNYNYGNDFTLCKSGELRCQLSMALFSGTNYFSHLKLNYRMDSWCNESVVFARMLQNYKEVNAF